MSKSGSYPLSHRNQLLKSDREQEEPEAQRGKWIEIPKVTSNTEVTKVKLRLSFTMSKPASRQGQC